MEAAWFIKAKAVVLNMLIQTKKLNYSSDIFLMARGEGVWVFPLTEKPHNQIQTHPLYLGGPLT